MGGSKKIEYCIKPIIICLTPVRNEAWILDKFLKCTSQWADYIIIADQNSTDESRKIALNFPKVILVENCSPSYNEIERQKLLINKARSIEGNKLLITLDADEFLCSGFSKTEEWNTMLNGEPGDSFAFRWINIFPGYKKGWMAGYFILALIDDGSEHNGNFIHNPRLPVSDEKKVHYLEEIKVLHYQYTNWNRMESKQRYYQCLERISFPEKRPLNLFRIYHHMYSIKPNSIIDLHDNLFSEYENLNIEMRSGISKTNEIFWFDKEILCFFDLYGVEKFKKEAIWDVNWNEYINRLRHKNSYRIQDPRNFFDKSIHNWLKSTQRFVNSKLVQVIDRIINHLW